MVECDKYAKYPEDTLGQKIRKQRFLKGYTAIELGRMCGISPNTVYCYESDLGIPNYTIMDRIVKVLNIDINYFEDDYYSFVLSPNYANFLKEWRKGHKVKELEEILGVSFTAYLAWENGQKMSRQTFNRIRHKLGI